MLRACTKNNRGTQEMTLLQKENKEWGFKGAREQKGKMRQIS